MATPESEGYKKNKPQPYTLVYERGSEGEDSMMVGMASNHDIHIRLDRPGVSAVSHTMTMADFDALVEAVHGFHAEVEDA